MALAAFLWLAWAVERGDTLAWDLTVHNDSPLVASPGLTTFMIVLTQLGSGWVLWPVGFAAVAWLERRLRRREAVWLAITVVGAFILNEAMKLVFHRPRPQPFFGYPAPDTFSFPSGHALNSCCFYLAVAEFLPHKPAARTAAIAITALIGFSRVYLGVHYPTDVIGGYLGAIAWTAAVRAADPHRGLYSE